MLASMMVVSGQVDCAEKFVDVIKDVSAAIILSRARVDHFYLTSYEQTN
jgi:hypothetical protein